MRRLDPTAVQPGPAVIVAYLLVVGLAAGVATVDGLEQSRLDVDVRIVDVTCGQAAPDAAWNVTGLEVAVANHDTAVVDPVVRVVHEGWHIQNAWHIVRGPATVAPGETATYQIAAPGDPARIRDDAVGVVRVANAGSQQRAATPAVQFDCPGTSEEAA